MVDMKTDKYLIRFFQVGNGSKGGDAILIRLFDDNDGEHFIRIYHLYLNMAGSHYNHGEQFIRICCLYLKAVATIKTMESISSKSAFCT